jgi:nitroreductase
MIVGSDKRTADHDVNRVFVDRWSSRAMSGEAIDEAGLMILFEAARWAPSSGNVQPWRMLYARRETPHWTVFFELVNESNRLWVHQAGALVLFLSRTVNDAGKASVTHSFDTGAAWENFALQGALKGWVVHGMQGFDYARARTVLEIPDEFRVEAMVAVGHPGPVEGLPEHLRPRETPNARRPLSQLVCEGPFRL